MTDSAKEATAGTVAITVAKAVADGTAVLGADGVLRVGGTSGADNLAIALVKSRGTSSVQVTSGSVTLGTFAASAVKEVRAWGRDADDQIRISGLSVNALLVGGAGDDTRTGGGGSNVVFGGAGRVTPNGGSAADFLVGGADADTATGNGGNDLLVGGRSPEPGPRTTPGASSRRGPPAATRRTRPTWPSSTRRSTGSRAAAGRDLLVVGQGDTSDVRTKDKDVLLKKA